VELVIVLTKSSSMPAAPMKSFMLELKVAMRRIASQTITDLSTSFLSSGKSEACTRPAGAGTHGIDDKGD
jgi:hypothetical protein